MLLLMVRYLDDWCIPESMGADLSGFSIVKRFGTASLNPGLFFCLAVLDFSSHCKPCFSRGFPLVFGGWTGILNMLRVL